MSEITKTEFYESEEPLTAVISVNPVTLETNIDFEEGWDCDWLKKSLEEDFPERFVFVRRNKAAKKLRSKEYFGYTG